MGRLLSFGCFALMIMITAGRPNAADLSGSSTTRTFEFVYRATILDIAAGQGPVHIFLPVPAENDQQSVESVLITTSLDEAALNMEAILLEPVRRLHIAATDSGLCRPWIPRLKTMCHSGRWSPL